MSQLEENSFATPAMLHTIIDAAIRAGQAIMHIYHSPEANWQVERKADNSPLTLADRQSHALIAQALEPTGIPLLSEEGAHLPYDERRTWQQLWIVDPLDGTKEFIKRNGEFTVNIALAHQGVPTMGVIYAPALGRLWWGTQQGGAFTATVATTDDAQGKAPYTLSHEQALPIATDHHAQALRIVASRSHLSPDTENFIHALRQTHGEVSLVSAGSSLKLCLVAEGHADIYPRLAPTMEWDTAAGHAIALAAGCTVTDAHTGLPLTYNKPDLHNPHFIVKRPASN